MVNSLTGAKKYSQAACTVTVLSGGTPMGRSTCVGQSSREDPINDLGCDDRLDGEQELAQTPQPLVETESWVVVTLQCKILRTDTKDFRETGTIYLRRWASGSRTTTRTRPLRLRFTPRVLKWVSEGPITRNPPGGWNSGALANASPVPVPAPGVLHTKVCWRNAKEGVFPLGSS